MERTILSIDCGTQSLRALLFTLDGELLDKKRVEYEPYFSPRPGWAEQDPELFWKSLCSACRALSEKRPDLFKTILGVGVTSQRDSMVNVDENGNPLRPVITWLDQRKAKQVYTPPGILRLMYRAVGMEEAIVKAQTDGKCNWIMQYQPEVWERTYKYLQVSGFLNFRLTGQFRDSVASQIGHIPFNYKKMRWATRRELSAKLFPIDAGKLPEVVSPGELIGTVTRAASEKTGIPQGVPVVACGSDKGCETIGMGVVDETSASLSFGTTATVQTTSKRYFEPLRFMPPYPAPIPGRYNPEVEIFRGYWMITWFKNEFGYREVLEARDKGVEPEELLNDVLTEVPAGSMGLLVQPYWGPGLKQPAAKGAMIGFGDVHRKAHVYRAVIEGLSYALLDGLEKIRKAGKCRMERVAVSGGASQSDEICRISADIFDLPLARGKTYETSGLGAAIVTAVGLGKYSSFGSAIERMVRYDVFFEPDPRNAAMYRQIYERVYKKMYRALSPLYREIRAITGYPEGPSAGERHP
ncbi:MAG: FGGY-family carbohydrate kinase [Desulfomonilaceae bacterium]|nr:FGGY-family carbohydrate kinase [Desulfomonilaceae bacterium]